MQEWQLYQAWNHYFRRGLLLNWRNHTLKIIDPGLLNTHQGPDFQGCRFIFDDVVYQGAAEMHIDQNDWYRHKHHGNPDYKNVLIHIIGREPQGPASVAHDQRAALIPSFVLPLKPVQPEAFQCRPGTGKVKSDKLKELALERLEFKTQSFDKRLQTNNIDQVFYSGFLYVLGYPHNKFIFKMLADRLPLYFIDRYGTDLDVQMALYLGSAGFLNNHSENNYARVLKQIFQKLQLYLPFTPLSEDQWQLGAARPFNHPQFRIAAWVNLMVRYKTCYIFEQIYKLLSERLPYRNLLQQLINFFKIPVRDYWQMHYTLAKPYKRVVAKYFLGKQRIHELIVNLIIPLAMSYARQRGSSGLVDYLSDFFFYLPGNGVYSSLQRRLPWTQSYTREKGKYFPEQAFLHLEQAYCKAGKCAICPLGRINVPHNGTDAFGTPEYKYKVRLTKN